MNGVTMDTLDLTPEARTAPNDYERVVEGFDDSGASLVIKLTHEGIIIDRFLNDGDQPLTFAMTYDELADSGLLR
jgi:hypothetical protein